MGACGSSGNRKKRKPDDKTPDERDKDNGTTPENGEIKEIGDNPIKEKIDEKKPILRGAKKTISGRSEYNYDLKDLLKDEEVKGKIPSDCKLFELLNKSNIRPNSDFIIEFENGYKIGYDKINERIGDLIEGVFKDKIPEDIIMNYTYKGLDIPEEDIKKEYIDSNDIIGSAILDNQDLFVIITYERNNRKITPYNYKRKDNEELIKFNMFTAFCNAKGCLYFSGGENEQTYDDPDKTVAKYNDFFYIDLRELNENDNKIMIRELPNLNEPRTWNSMIYVPKKYIFIVGGSNTKSVELYNMETKTLTKDSELNENRSECSLCLVNNTYLYAFYGFVIHQEYNKTIEKCNLLREERKWEYVEYKNTISNSETNFKLSFFGISYFNNNEILLIGGDDNGDEKHYDYLYKIGENGVADEISEFNCNLNESNNVFRDKLFMPIEYNKSVNIPLIVGEDIRIFILDTSTGNITIQNYNNSLN